MNILCLNRKYICLAFRNGFDRSIWKMLFQYLIYLRLRNIRESFDYQRSYFENRFFLFRFGWRMLMIIDMFSFPTIRWKFSGRHRDWSSNGSQGVVAWKRFQDRCVLALVKHNEEWVVISIFKIYLSMLFFFFLLSFSN